MSQNNKTQGAAVAASSNAGPVRMLVIVALVIGAFFGAYRFAQARSGNAQVPSGAQGQLASSAGAGSNAAGGAGCACCGSSAPTEGGLTGEKVEGVAKVDGAVQKISVDVSQGFYAPNQIVLKAGVPAEITFANGTGCTQQVVSDALGFSEDMGNGPVTVKIDSPQPGEYPFYCGMQMVYGKIVVK